MFGYDISTVYGASVDDFTTELSKRLEKTLSAHGVDTDSIDCNELAIDVSYDILENEATLLRRKYDAIRDLREYRIWMNMCSGMNLAMVVGKKMDQKLNKLERYKKELGLRRKKVDDGEES